jgi:hypothetical protein
MPLNSAPAAAPVLAAAAPLVPKKNPPAIKCAESKEPYNVFAISGKKWKRNIEISPTKPMKLLDL